MRYRLLWHVRDMPPRPYRVLRWRCSAFSHTRMRIPDWDSSQALRKDIQEMLKAELDTELGYSLNSQAAKTRGHTAGSVYVRGGIRRFLPHDILQFFGKFEIFRRLIHSFDVVIVPVSGYFEEPAHFTDRIFFRMTIDHHVFDLCFHFLSVSERKSRISSFSISNCFIHASLRANLYRNSVSLSSSVTTLSFAGLPYFLIVTPAAVFRCCTL